MILSWDGDPFTVHFDFIVVAIHPTLSRTTIRVVTAGAAVFLYEAIVEIPVPFIVADPEISFLSGSTRKRNAEKAPPRATLTTCMSIAARTG